MSNVSIVVGAQWGDEGKGKWVDIFAESVDLVARYQGGNNAGHTLVVDGKKIVLHQIPSGILHEGKISAMGAGVVVNPTELLLEIDKIQEWTKVSPDNLWVSSRAHVITPWHIYLDGHREQFEAQKIGTTRRGIGPTYQDKASRAGLRLSTYIDDEAFENWLVASSERDQKFEGHRETNEDEWAAFREARSRIKPFICDAESNLREAIDSGKKVIFEGAQGALLDVDHGTFPFVTSSTTMAGGAITCVGFPPRKVGRIVGIAKAYCTRVGEGPFPTELNDEAGKHLADCGHEFGATTGRPRRCGWLDMVALRYSFAANGMDELILNKLDVLAGLKEIQLCVSYRHPQHGELTGFPADSNVLAACEPVYETLPGWSKPIEKCRSFDELPKEAQNYLRRCEELLQGKISYVGVGVGRDDGFAI